MCEDKSSDRFGTCKFSHSQKRPCVCWSGAGLNELLLYTPNLKVIIRKPYCNDDDDDDDDDDVGGGDDHNDDNEEKEEEEGEGEGVEEDFFISLRDFYTICTWTLKAPVWTSPKYFSI